MPLPAAYSTPTVRCEYVREDGTAPSSVRVVFAGSPPASIAGVTVTPLVHQVVWSAAENPGAGSAVLTQVLRAGDDPDASPVGWSWQVTEHVDGVQLRPTWSFVLPADVTEVDLADVAPVPPTTGVTAYVTVSALAGHVQATTGVHGITDTAALIVTTDPRLADARTPLAHAHTPGDVTGLVEQVQDTVAAMLVAGAGVTIVYDDTAGTLQVSASGGGGDAGPLAVASYNPAVADSPTAPASHTDVNAALTVTFTVPASGTVLVRLSGSAYAAFSTVWWGLRSAGALVAGSEVIALYRNAAGESTIGVTRSVHLTGLTPGASMTCTWSHRGTGGGITSAGGTNGPAVMEVWAV